MGNPTYAEATQMTKDELMAVVISGKNPDGTTWAITTE